MKHFFYSMIVPVLVLLISIRPCIGSNRIQIPIDKELSSTCVSITTLESNSNYYKINVKINQLNDETIIKNNQVFHQLSLDDNKTLKDVGKPALPVISQFIGLPVGCTFSSMITDEKWTDVCIGKIYPAQKPRTDISEDSTFAYSEEDYNVTCFKHQLLSESEVMTWKGIENVYLTLCPFKYYPLENRMSVLSEFTLIVRFSAKKQKTPHKITIKERDLSVFDNKNFLSMEYLESASSMTRTSNDDYDYLIIVGNIPAIENSQEMKDFRRWKALKGFKTKVVSTSTIGSDSASIKSFIDNEYDTYSIERVLFVGDHTKIPLPIFPAKQSQSDHLIDMSDYWYGCTDGENDIQCNLPIARIATNTLSDFTNVVNKTITYESIYHGWANNVLLTCHNQLSGGSPLFQEPLDTVYNSYHNAMNFTKAFATPNSIGGNSSTISDVISHLNSGMNIFVVNSHGNAGGFWLFDGNNSTLFYCDTTLLNNDTHFVCLSNACFNGNFTSQYSIMKDFMRSNHSSSAFVGCSVASYTLAQNKLTKRLFSNLLDHNQYILGNLILNSHIENLSYGNTAVDNAFSTIISGDPTLELWTGNQEFFCDVAISLSGNNMVINIEDIDDYVVNVVSSEGNLVSRYPSVGNNVTIPIIEGDFDFAINKHGYIPYVVHVDLSSHYIQNMTLSENICFYNSPISIGYDVTSLLPNGNVVIEPGAKVRINKGSGVLIKNNFECKQGGEFVIE